MATPAPAAQRRESDLSPRRVGVVSGLRRNLLRHRLNPSGAAQAPA